MAGNSLLQQDRVKVVEGALPLNDSPVDPVRVVVGSRKRISGHPAPCRDRLITSPSFPVVMGRCGMSHSNSVVTAFPPA